MNVEMAARFLLWSTVLNYMILLVWFLVFIFAHDFIHRLHGRWFHLSRERFDTLHYGSMAVFKLGIILFNLTPYIVLTLVR